MTTQMNTDPNRVIIFDTTLRDGEQSPGCSMNLEEKLRVAKMLETMGVDVIEAGFPIASPGDFESVHEIAKVVKNSIVCGLARSGNMDVDSAGEAVKPAERKRIHTFISTSPLHMSVKLQMDPEDVHQAVIDSVTRARKYTDDVEWSAEDGTRTEHDFLCRCIESAIKAGATTVNIPDTVGYTVPEEYAALMRMIFDRVPNIDKAVVSVHCHNDLGMAVANTIAGVQGGARQSTPGEHAVDFRRPQGQHPGPLIAAVRGMPLDPADAGAQLFQKGRVGPMWAGGRRHENTVSN